MAAYNTSEITRDYNLRLSGSTYKASSFISSEMFAAGESFLLISSEPSGANIYLNTIFQGTSSLTVTGITAGVYSYTASLDGYYTYYSQVTASTGANNLSIVLVAQQLTASQPAHRDRPSII